jgi:hypothetical protein
MDDSGSVEIGRRSREWWRDAVMSLYILTIRLAVCFCFGEHKKEIRSMGRITGEWGTGAWDRSVWHGLDRTWASVLLSQDICLWRSLTTNWLLELWAARQANGGFCWSNNLYTQYPDTDRQKERKREEAALRQDLKDAEGLRLALTVDNSTS